MNQDLPLNEEQPLTGGGRSVVSRAGNVVFREAGPWSDTTIALLKHLEVVGYPHAPRVVGEGFDERGRETLSYVEGEVDPGPWKDEALPVIGKMLTDLHRATATFEVPERAVWRPWFGREVGNRSARVIGHCDTGPWNIVSNSGIPTALIDWEEAGPVDPMFELAQACWLNAQLYDDDIAKKVGLGSVEQRARQVQYLLDGYELPRKDRAGFADRLLECALLDAAKEAIDANVTCDTKDPESLWAITWRTRSAAWILRNRETLQRIISG